MDKRRLLFIGWDAADWKIINPLLEKRCVPAIESMISQGVMGNLVTMHPVLSPILWNSIGTGKRPAKHGILGFTEFNPHTGEVTPSLSTSRKVKALWNILSQEGLKTHMINWFASHPAEAINGICISDFYSKMPKTKSAPWELPGGTVHPHSQTQSYSDLRIHPSELDAEILKLFVPLMHKVDQMQDMRLSTLSKLVAEAFSIHNAVTHVMENEEWDFIGVYYGCIDHFCHAFMHYHPPKMEDTSPEDFEVFHQVIDAAYLMHDRMLGRLLDLAGEDTTVVLCSDHGFHSDELRPKGSPAIPAGPAVWHRDQGILMMKGPNIRKDELVHGAGLLDIAPTILHAMGLPIGRDMDGRPLLEVFKTVEDVKTIESWENRPGEHPDGMHSEDVKVSREESQAILDQFVALGYIDSPDENADDPGVEVGRELKWNLAASILDGGDVLGAIPILEEVVDLAPERSDYVTTLASCLQSIELFDVAAGLVNAILKNNTNDGNDPRPNRILAEMALARGEADLALRQLEPIAKNLEKIDGDTAGSWAILGICHGKLRHWNEALDCYQKAVEVDPDYARAYLGIAQSLLRLHRYEEAAEAALSCVELEHHLTQGHFILGRALLRLTEFSRAVEAFATALRYSPYHVGANRLMGYAFEQQGEPEKAQQSRDRAMQIHREREDARSRFAPEREKIAHRNLERVKRVEECHRKLAEQRAQDLAEGVESKDRMPGLGQPPVMEPSGKSFVIVSGLPRSGTSLMMQMLRAGGLEAMTDDVRSADDDNPEGYLEWEEIKQIKNRPELMDKAEGKATKVISMLLPHLPPQHEYKIIFMGRPIDEIVASQQKMLTRRGKQDPQADLEAMKKNLQRHRSEIIGMAQRRMNTEIRVIRYPLLIDDPESIVQRLVNFLGDAIPHPEKMAEVVNPNLYRNKATTTETIQAEATQNVSGLTAQQETK